jgi:DNA-binding transcriptional ArsR family regulator
MTDEPNIATPAALIGDPTRAAFLLALFDGRAQPAGALAYAAGVSAQVASNHLARLVAGGLLSVETQGRHRYYRLANAQVAGALEAMSALATPLRSIDRPSSPKARQLRLARCCYDHLAGSLGVAIAATLERRGHVVSARDDDPKGKRLDISAAGRRWLRDIGVESATIKPTRRGVARRCLDWTERRHHVAGPLGRALLERFCALDWIARQGSSRAVRVTPEGARRFREHFEIDLGAMEAREEDRARTAALRRQEWGRGAGLYVANG